MKAYKMVYDSICKGLESIYTGSFNAVVEYVPQKWVSPRNGCGPLCCFESLEDAEKLHEKYSIRHQVWECEIVKSRHEKVWDTEKIKMLKDLLEGTILADKVKLIRRIL